MPQQQPPYREPTTFSGEQAQLLKMTKIIQINTWLQHTDSILLLKRGEETYDLDVVALNSVALTTDGKELTLSPVEIDELLEMTNDYLAIKRLPDRRLVMVLPLLWGYANLGIGMKPPLENVGVFADSWQFPTCEAALLAWKSWNPVETAEPYGWDRHVRSGRRRPGGDAAREYVKDE